MSLLPPPSLVRHVREGRAVLFCGSGLSAWARLPTWSALLREIVAELGQEVPDDSGVEDLGRLLAAGKLLEVADHCKEALGERRYFDALARRLRGVDCPVPEAHGLVVRTPFSAVVTTNYDKLLERAYAAAGAFPKVPTHRDVDALGPLLFDGSFFVLKAHGDIDRPETMVLTGRDYQQIIHANPAFNAIFSAILLTRSILFVGYSLNDPDFRLLLDRQLTLFGSHVPERYALMSGVGRVEREVLWRTSRIQVLSYPEGEHQQVLEFLRALQRETGSQPESKPESPLPRIDGTQPEILAPPPLAPSLAPPILALHLRGDEVESELTVAGSTMRGTGGRLDWAELTKSMPRGLSSSIGARLLGGALAALLPAEVRSALAALPPDGPLALRLSPGIELLPWEMMEIEGRPLVLRVPVVRQPALSAAARGQPAISKPARVLLIGDPVAPDDTLSLPGAYDEVQQIAEIYRGCPVVNCDSLVRAQGSFDAVAAALLDRRYDVVHFAGHAWFDEDTEPYLLLRDGVHLRASELRSLLSPHPPALLVLNSHFTVFTPPGAARDGGGAGSESRNRPGVGGHRGFLDTAASAGVGTLIGSFSGELNDLTAGHVGVALHRALAAGEPVARALHRAIVERAADSSDPSHLTYAMSGYGDLTLPS